MKHVVTVGGGTGSYTILSGLKKLEDIHLTALVSMADDGGSTGVLRDELGVLPPGDVRQCLVALSEHSEMVRKLMGYRFSKGSLSGHTFGNIFLAALEKVTGDFVEGVEIASEILKVKGQVVPVTRDKADLMIDLENGKTLKGEDKINSATNIQGCGMKKIYYKNEVRLNGTAKDVISQADLIIIGPGNLYPSLVPALIVKGFKEAIKKSNAKVLLVVNLTNKHGHNMHWKASDYVKVVEKHLGKKLDYILVNSENPSKEQIKQYQLKEGDGVLVEDDLRAKNGQEDTRIIREKVLSHMLIEKPKGDKIFNLRSFIRHDGDKLAQCIMSLLSKK